LQRNVVERSHQPPQMSFFQISHVDIALQIYDLTGKVAHSQRQ